MLRIHTHELKQIDIKFKKSGTVLKHHLKAKVLGYNSVITGLKIAIENICIKRGIDPTEVLSAEEEGSIGEGYENKSAGINSMPAQFAELRADLERLKRYWRDLKYAEECSEIMSAISNNLDERLEYELSLADLLRLGL